MNDITDQAQKKADHLTRQAKNNADELGDKVSDGAEDVADKVSDGAEDLADKVQDHAEQLGDKVKDGADELGDRAEKTADELGDKAQHALGDVKTAATEAVDKVTAGHGLLNRISRVGVRSEYAYIAGFVSIGLSLTSWLVSRGKTGDSKAQSDRWGIFIGHWAPTFMALGVALKLEEDR